MKIKGFETKNYREVEFLRLPGMGRKTLRDAKEAGANFAPAKDIPPPVYGRGPHYDPQYSDARPRAKREERGEGMYTYIPGAKAAVKECDSKGNPIGTKYDGYDNPIFDDGAETI